MCVLLMVLVFSVYEWSEAEIMFDKLILSNTYGVVYSMCFFKNNLKRFSILFGCTIFKCIVIAISACALLILQMTAW